MEGFVKHKKISMKKEPDFSEKWLQNAIADDPSVLGLGELEVRALERTQPRAGRLDMLLQDPVTNTRFEVELQLGATDETHIIRTIEYWDIERRRYPQYEHVAVIVAEDITTRFFNVIGLFNGFIPIVAIQANMIELAGAKTVIFTKVLDQMKIGIDEDDQPAEPTDRAYWEKKGSPTTMSLLDDFMKIVNEVDPDVQPNFNKHYVGMAKNGSAANFLSLRPQKKRLLIEFKGERNETMRQRIEDAELELLRPDQWSEYRIPIGPGGISEHEALLRELTELAYSHYGL